MSEIKENLILILMFVLMLIVFLAGLSFGVLEIYVWIKYANVPVAELPAWVAWLMFKS